MANESCIPQIRATDRRPRHPIRGRADQLGFTLLEVLASIAVLAVLGAALTGALFALVRADGQQRSRAEAAVVAATSPTPSTPRLSGLRGDLGVLAVGGGSDPSRPR